MADVTKKADSPVRRVLIERDPFIALDESRLIWTRGHWPVKWLELPAPAPSVAAYRLKFTCDADQVLRVHVSAGERYRLFVDGQSVGVGPERGDEKHWRFETLDLHLDPGEHWLAAEVWALGPIAPVWQAPVTPGFLLAAEGDWLEKLSTGHAPWQVMNLDAYTFEPVDELHMTGPRAVVDGTRMPWGWVTGHAGNFSHAVAQRVANSQRAITGRQFPALIPASTAPVTLDLLPPGRVVHVEHLNSPDRPTPALEPAQHDSIQQRDWQRWLHGETALTIPAGRTLRGLVDLGTYRACWPVVSASGAGGMIRVQFAEGLFEQRSSNSRFKHKGNRDQWLHKQFDGLGPTFRTATGSARLYQSLDWECGRWLEIVVSAGPEPLRLEALELRDASYPLQDEGLFETDDRRLIVQREIGVHTLRVGTHSHFCDCPYYERLQYIGDTRLEALVTYTLTKDSALQRRALLDFAGARSSDGQLPSRHPARGLQVIPPFSLWWVHMLRDYAWWRDDAALVKELLPVARGVLDAWWACQNGDGLIENPPGWNFVDWVPAVGDAPAWRSGMPPGASWGGDHGVSTILNWHAAWTAKVLAELEAHFGDEELHRLNDRRASQLAQALDATWDSARQRFSDKPGGAVASEHVQCLALLSGLLREEKRESVARSLCEDADLTRTTIYFTHYLFEAYAQVRRIDLLLNRMQLWFDLTDVGLMTTPEQPEPTRSDCHPWGTHPTYHFAATLAGIRPASPGFKSVRIDPQPGTLKNLRVAIPHPQGRIELNWQQGQTWTVQSPVPVVQTLE